MAKITGRRGAGRGGNGRKLTPADNKAPELTPEQMAVKATEEKRQREEAEGIQLLSILGRVKPALARIETARAALKLEQDASNDIFRAAKLQSKDFTRERLMELVNDTKPGSRKDVLANEETRARFRRILGLPVGLSDTERDLESRLPDVTRDGMFYRAAGYTDGVSGNPRNPPPGCAEAGHGNLYDEGYKDGQRIVGENSHVKAKPAAPKPAAEETELQRKRREKAEEQAALAGLEAAPKPAAEGEPPTYEHSLERAKAMLANDPANDALMTEVADREAAGEKANPDEVAFLTEEIAQAAPEGGPNDPNVRDQTAAEAEAAAETV